MTDNRHKHDRGQHPEFGTPEPLVEVRKHVNLLVEIENDLKRLGPLPNGKGKEQCQQDLIHLREAITPLNEEIAVLSDKVELLELQITDLKVVNRKLKASDPSLDTDEDFINLDQFSQQVSRFTLEDYGKVSAIVILASLLVYAIFMGLT